MKSLDSLRRNMSDLGNLFVLPMLVAALPWSLGFRLLKLLARRADAFRREADAAWAIAALHIDDIDVSEWKFRYRLVRWIERADTFLTLTRSARWWRRRTEIRGEWPNAEAACLLLTYHWGAGHWVWKLLSERGIHAHFLARRPVIGDLGVSRVALWFGNLRGWALSRIGSLGPLYTGRSVERMKAAMAAGHSIVGMLDLPAQPSQQPRPVALLGREARLPSRLIEIARQDAAAIVLFSCGVDFDSGGRRLRIEALPGGLDDTSILNRYADHLSACLRSAPECWMMWHEAQSIFIAGAADS